MQLQLNTAADQLWAATTLTAWCRRLMQSTSAEAYSQCLSELWAAARADQPPERCQALEQQFPDSVAPVWELLTQQWQLQAANDAQQQALLQWQAWAKDTDHAASERAAVQALQEQEAIFETVSLGIMFVVNRVVRRCNPAMELMFGYAPGEMVGCSTRILYPSQEAFEQIAEFYAPRVESGALFQTTYQFQRKDGSCFWGQSSGRKVDVADSSKGSVWVFENITEKHAAAQQAQDNLREQQVIFEAVSLGIMFIIDRKIKRCNPLFERMFGYDRDEMLGHPTRLIYQTDEQFELAGSLIYIPIAQGLHYEGEWEFRRKDGSLFWGRTYGRAIDSSDVSKGSVWVYEDVTDRRRASAELLAAKEAADAASRAKSEFLANMSHEIRTPMNAIIGMSYLALNTELSPRQHDYISKIRQSGQHLLGILNDILDFSKVEVGKLTIENLPFNLHEVMSNVVALIADKARSKQLSLVCDLPPDVPVLLQGDALRLSQVLINYANNAIKFTEQGSITLAVSIATRTPSDVLLRFEVRDTGIGLSEAQRSRLFQSFSQADSTITRQYGGTGLGLAISKQLAQLMGGQVGVSSELGRGSVFWFTAKLGLAAEGVAPSPPTGRDTAALDALRSAFGARVLLVEDNAMNQQVATELLHMAGLVVEVADNGQIAVDRIVQSASGLGYDVVLMDMQMPVMDGVTAAGLVRADGRFKDLPILAMTANAMQVDRDRCKAAGMDDFVAKPIEPDDLWSTLARWIRPRAGLGGDLSNAVPHAVAQATPQAKKAQGMPALPAVANPARAGQATQEVTPQDRAAATKCLTRLRKLLKADGPDAREYFAEHTTLLRKVLGTVHPRIAAALTQEEFELARELLEAAPQ